MPGFDNSRESASRLMKLCVMGHQRLGVELLHLVQPVVHRAVASLITMRSRLRAASSVAPCERVYPANWWMDNGDECPNPTCEGMLEDGWGVVLLREHPIYPGGLEAREHQALRLGLHRSRSH
jgi:hypothetical protein